MRDRARLRGYRNRGRSWIVVVRRVAGTAASDEGENERQQADGPKPHRRATFAWSHTQGRAKHTQPGHEEQAELTIASASHARCGARR